MIMFSSTEQTTTATTTMVAVAVVFSLMALSTVWAAPSAQHQDRSEQRDQKQLPSDELIMLNPNEVYLGGADCKENEQVVLGLPPQCEPTCDDPRPICPKVFTVLDKPFCFCKDSLVRHKPSNSCIELEKCD